MKMGFLDKKYSFGLCLLVFCVGALSQFDVTLIARVPLGELLAFGAIPFLLNGGRYGKIARRLTPVIWVLLIWSLGIILSDFLNDFIFLRFIRAFMKPLFSGFWMLFFIGVILRDFRALIFYPLGKVLASLQNYLAPRAFSEGYMEAGGYETVAYGLMPIATALCVAFAVLMYQRSRLWAVIAFLSNATTLLAIGAPRSAAAISILNAGVIFYIWWTRSKGRRSFHLSKGRLYTLGLLGVIAGLSIYYAYVFAAGQGWLGESQYAKLIDQQDTVFGSSPLGLILGGRTYVFAAILAIIDQPFLGYGSWTGWMMSDYYFEAVSMVGTNTAEVQRLVDRGGGGMAGHSVLFQGWLENGLLCAIALCVIAYWTVREFLLLIQRDNRITPWVVVLVSSFAWSFFFSPFGVGTRMTIGLFLAFHVLRFHEQNEPSSNLGGPMR
jgi:hypothetical protein